MITKVIPIGNSKGIRIPNHVLKDMNIGSQLEMIVNQDDGEIILKPLRKPREGWDESFKTMHERGEDALVIDDSIDSGDWEW